MSHSSEWLHCGFSSWLERPAWTKLVGWPPTGKWAQPRGHPRLWTDAGNDWPILRPQVAPRFTTTCGARVDFEEGVILRPTRRFSAGEISEWTNWLRTAECIARHSAERGIPPAIRQCAQPAAFFPARLVLLAHFCASGSSGVSFLAGSATPRRCGNEPGVCRIFFADDSQWCGR